MEAYKRVALARKKTRPTGQDFIDNLFTDFIELHGDRCFGDDPAVISGLGMLIDMPVTVIAQERGKNTKSRVKRNFGSAHPEGYRKALRQMQLAEKFNRPIVCLIDTSGAFCGIGAEERGQGLAIANNLMEMMSLKVPILSVVIGEGGSGGALALGVADEVWMLENAIYSVISPEGCASILWKDAAKTKEAANCLKLTAKDLLELQVIDKIISETHRDFKNVYRELKIALYKGIQKNQTLESEQLIENRYQRFRKYGAIETIVK